MTDIDFIIIEQKDKEGNLLKTTIKVQPILYPHYSPLLDAFDSINCSCPICVAANKGKEISIYHTKITQCPQCGVNLDWSKYEEKCKGLGVLP